MPDQSLSMPSTLASTDFHELIDNLHSVVTLIDDCKWVADALHLSASSSDKSASHETNWRTVSVSRIIFTTLRKASNDILNIIEVLEVAKVMVGGDALGTPLCGG